MLPSSPVHMNKLSGMAFGIFWAVEVRQPQIMFNLYWTQNTLVRSCHISPHACVLYLVCLIILGIPATLAVHRYASQKSTAALQLIRNIPAGRTHPPQQETQEKVCVIFVLKSPSHDMSDVMSRSSASHRALQTRHLECRHASLDVG